MNGQWVQGGDVAGECVWVWVIGLVGSPNWQLLARSFRNHMSTNCFNSHNQAKGSDRSKPTLRFERIESDAHLARRERPFAFIPVAHTLYDCLI